MAAPGDIMAPVLPIAAAGEPRARRPPGEPEAWAELLMAASVAEPFEESHRVSALSAMPGALSPIWLST